MFQVNNVLKSVFKEKKFLQQEFILALKAQIC